MRFSASIVEPTPPAPELEEDELLEELLDELELEDELLDELLLLEELLLDVLRFPPPQATNAPMVKLKTPAFSNASPLFPELASVMHVTLYFSGSTGRSRFLLSGEQQWGDKVACK